MTENARDLFRSRDSAVFFVCQGLFELHFGPGPHVPAIVLERVMQAHVIFLKMLIFENLVKYSRW